MTENASWNTDSDDLPNDIEARFGSDPRKLDTNGDGLLDAKELQATTSPTNRDSGADGIDDRADDVDGDGLSTGGDRRGTDPGDPDSDDDGLDDGAEKKFASSPLACAGWLEVSERTPLTSDGRPFTAHSPKPPSAPPPERSTFRVGPRTRRLPSEDRPVSVPYTRGAFHHDLVSSEPPASGAVGQRSAVGTAAGRPGR